MVEPIKLKKWTELKEYIFEKPYAYYMLLCHERRDYTIFHLVNDDKISANVLPVELFACLRNRGGLVSMDLVNSGTAWEIWLRIDDEDFMYALFPYDEGVIEI